MFSNMLEYRFGAPVSVITGFRTCILTGSFTGSIALPPNETDLTQNPSHGTSFAWKSKNSMPFWAKINRKGIEIAPNPIKNMLKWSVRKMQKMSKKHDFGENRLENRLEYRLE